MCGLLCKTYVSISGFITTIIEAQIQHTSIDIFDSKKVLHEYRILIIASSRLSKGEEAERDIRKTRFHCIDARDAPKENPVETIEYDGYCSN